MKPIVLCSRDYAALQAALDAPPEPTERLTALMRGVYNAVLIERIPDDLRQLVEKLK